MDFRNTVIVMTSNLGSHRTQELISEEISEFNSDEKLKNTLLEIVKKHFSPEFVNRIDETVIFHPLYRRHIRSIAEIQIDRLNSRLANNRLSVELSSEAIDRLADSGFDPVFGARPLKRAIQNVLENPLAEGILDGKYTAENKISVDVDREGRLVFK